MMTKAILVQTLVNLILLFGASSAHDQTPATTTSPSPSVNITTTLTEDSTQGWKQSTVTTKERSETKQKDSTTASSIPSGFRTTVKLNSSVPTTNATTTSSSTQSLSKLILFLILVAIIVLVLCVGCIHAMWKQESGEGSSAPRLLLSMRHRLREAIWRLRFWSGGKRGGEDDDEEEADGSQGEEGGQKIDDAGKGAGCGARNKEKEEHEEIDSDDSHSHSSMEGDNQKAERKQNVNEDGEETSSGSEGDQSAVEGESGGDKKKGLEEIALVNCPQEDDEQIDLCDVTVL